MTPAAGQTPRKPARPPRKHRPLVATLAIWSTAAVVWIAVAIGAAVAWYGADLPDIDDAIKATRRPAVTVLAADGTELATAGDLYGEPVQVRELPPALPLAVLAIEDRRFYDHFGVDPWGLLRAVVANARAGGVVQGGSTISQQVAKNLFLSPERSMKRKIQELVLALWLERKFSKNQILALYLNRAYFGAGTYGVDAAARKYFGVPATRVSTWQAAMLAGLLRAPSRYNPIASMEAANARTRLVLDAMVDAGFLKESEAKAAALYRGAMLANGPGTRSSRWFVDWVLDQVGTYVGARDKDLIVTTTLDLHLQQLAEKRVVEALNAAGGKANVEQAALVAMAPDGAVRALVGGRDYSTSKFNRVTQALRQPGSAFKPFVYLAGLEAGLSPDSRFVDAPLSIRGWKPKNFDNRYRGEISLREALAESVNTVAVRVGEHAGRRHVVEIAHRLGITSNVPVTPSVSLGVADISLLELTSAYAVFANGGFGVWPYAIEAVHDTDGRLLYRRTGDGPGRVVAPRYIAEMTEMMVGVIRHGTGRQAALGRPAAGKTGTSQNFRDAWFIGFTADLVTGVWMGNDDGDETKGVIGGNLPAKLWRGFMEAAHAGLPARPLAGLTDEAPAARPAAAAAPQPNIIDWLIDKLSSTQ